MPVGGRSAERAAETTISLTLSSLFWPCLLPLEKRRSGSRARYLCASSPGPVAVAPAAVVVALLRLVVVVVVVAPVP
jgi:hypothetical protein